MKPLSNDRIAGIEIRKDAMRGEQQAMAQEIRARRALGDLDRLARVGATLAAAARPLLRSVRGDPACCPFCGGSDIVFIMGWNGRSQEPQDADNVADLAEWQCRDCDNRSFWV